MQKPLSVLLTSALLLAALPAAAAQDTQPQAQTQPTQTQQTDAKLTNKDVVDLVRAGIGPAVVVAKIKSSANDFDTSPAALQELKGAGVPDEVILAMVQAAPAPAAAPQPTGTAAAEGDPVEAKVPDGTEIEVELKNNVSGQEVKVGDIVDLTVVRPVQVGGVTVIDKGAPARARITVAKKAGHWGKAGKLEWTMQDVQAMDGSRLPARFTKRDTGDSKGGTVATATAITAVVFFPAAPLWGFKKGKPAVMPAGTRYTVFVHGDTAVKGKAAPAAPAQ